MPKIPKETAWTRFKTFLRGLLLYNTIYWRRASDGLHPPRPTKAERRANRPHLDLSIVKPRERPRAKLDSDAAEGAPHQPAAAAIPAPRQAAIDPAATLAAGPEKRRKRKKHRRASLVERERGASSFRRIFGREI